MKKRPRHHEGDGATTPTRMGRAIQCWQQHPSIPAETETEIKRTRERPHRPKMMGARWGATHDWGDPAKGPRGAQPTHRILQVRFDLGGGVLPVLGVRTQQVPDEGQC